jgi:hypothetical protein
MGYAKDVKKDTVYTSVNQFIQPKKSNGRSVMPSYPAPLQAKSGGANEESVAKPKPNSPIVALKPDDGGKGREAEKRLVRKKAVEKFEAQKTGLFGLEKVYQEYQLYKTHLSNSNLSTSISLSLAQSGYMGPGFDGGFADTITINRQRKAVNNSLKTYGFKGGIAQFEQAIKEYETGFESESVYIANNLLDCYSHMLAEAQKRYADAAVAQALFNRLAVARGHYQKAEGYKDQYFRMSMGAGGGMFSPWSLRFRVLEQMRQEKELGRKGVEALTANHPLFKDDHLPENKRLDKEKLALAKNGKELQAVLSKYIRERQTDISETRKRLKDNPTLIYSLDNLLTEAYRQQDIEKNSIYDLIITDKARDIKLFSTVISLALAVFAVALGLLSGGTGTLAVMAAVGAVGLSAYDVYREIEQYQTQSHLSGTGLTTDDANIIWVVVAIAGAGLDIGAALKTARALKPAVKAMEAGGDVAKFEDGVQALLKTRKIDAKLADVLMETAKARAGFEKTAQAFAKKLGSKVYSFPGPLTDPDIYADLVKLAYYKVKEGVTSFRIFYLEIKKARTLARLGEMNPQELGKLKEAWEEGLSGAGKGVFSSEDLLIRVTQGMEFKSIGELPKLWREKAYSLVELYNKLNQPGRKTIAATKSGKTTISGFGTSDSAERLLTEKVITKQKQIGQVIESSGAFDQGKNGYYLACHAEKKLSIIAPNEPIVVKGPLHCPNCQNYFELLAKYTGETQIILNSKFLYIYTPQGKIVIPK